MSDSLLVVSSSNRNKGHKACNPQKKLEDLIDPPERTEGPYGWKPAAAVSVLTRTVKHDKFREESMRIPKQTQELVCQEVSGRAGSLINKSSHTVSLSSSAALQTTSERRPFALIAGPLAPGAFFH